jgi:hypothetical protein
MLFACFDMGHIAPSHTGAMATPKAAILDK